MLYQDDNGNWTSTLLPGGGGSWGTGTPGSGLPNLAGRTPSLGSLGLGPSDPTTPGSRVGPGGSIATRSYALSPDEAKSFVTEQQTQKMIDEANATGAETDTGGHNWITGTFDVLARPSYVVQGELMNALGLQLPDSPRTSSPGDIALAGLEGVDKPTFSKAYASQVDPNATETPNLGDLFSTSGPTIGGSPISVNALQHANAFGVHGKYGAALLGFISDIATDPMTYFGFGIDKAAQGIDALQGAKDVGQVASAGEAATTAGTGAAGVAGAASAAGNIPSAEEAFQSAKAAVDAGKAGTAVAGATEAAPAASELASGTNILKQAIVPTREAAELKTAVTPLDKAIALTKAADRVRADVATVGTGWDPQEIARGVSELLPELKAGEKIGEGAGKLTNLADVISGGNKVADIPRVAADTAPNLGHLTFDSNGALREVFKSEPLLGGGQGANDARNAIDTAGRDAFTNTAKNAGKTLGVDYSRADVIQAGKNAVSTAEDAAAARATTTAQKLNALASVDPVRTVSLKFLGKPIVSSKLLGSAVTKADDAFKGTKVGQALEDAFVRGNGIPHDIYAAYRRASNVGAAEYESGYNDLQKHAAGQVEGFTRISRSDADRLTQAMEGTNGMSRAMLSPELQAHYDYIRQMYENAAERRIAAGTLTSDQLRPDFVQHVYQNTKLPAFGENARPSSGYFSTVEQAKAAGAKPVTDAYAAVAHYQARAYREINEYNMMKSFADQYGIDLARATGARKAAIGRGIAAGTLTDGNKLGSQALKGYAFLSEHANAIQKVQKLMRPNSPENIALLRHIDSVMSKWRIMTIARPGSRVRHGLGQIFNNYLDGLVNPHRYDQAVSVLRTKTGTEDAYKTVLTLTTKNGEKIPLSRGDVAELFDGQGLRSGYFMAQNQIASPSGIGRIGSRTAQVSERLVQRMTETQDNIARVAHFIDAMKKEAPESANLGEAAQRAAARVQKFNFDMRDLTPFEQRYMKRLVPFYTFTRNNIPLQAEMMFARPGRQLVVPKAEYAMQTALNPHPSPVGTDLKSKIPGVSGVIPNWLSQLNPIQLTPEGPGANATYFTSPDPFSEAINEVTNPSQTFASQLNPLLEIPLEQSVGRNLATQAPISGGLFDRIKEEIPPLATGQQMFNSGGTNPTWQVPLPFGKTQSIQKEAALNTLLPFNIRDITQNRVRGEMMRQQDILAPRIKAAKDQQAAAKQQAIADRRAKIKAGIPVK